MPQKVREVMTPDPTVDSTAPATEAAALMATGTRARSW
jgi:hypothetical protein